jgi:hypothetical protein
MPPIQKNRCGSVFAGLCQFAIGLATTVFPCEPGEPLL